MNNDIKYLEAKEFARDSFTEFFEDNKFTVEQSIAAALEDNIFTIYYLGSFCAQRRFRKIDRKFI
ncbi:hypothetical protein FACS189418_0040 [Clostridia bacterium]|nr:hypothetical protein FACS189418_0040 [Clostridia bacterium]